MIIGLYTIWCGMCWVLRGGAWGVVLRWLGKNGDGTDKARFAAAALMTVPLWAYDPSYLLVLPFAVVSMKIGYFNKSMGLEKPWDWAWLALWGVTISLIALVPIAIVQWRWEPLVLALLGALISAGYAINKSFGGHWTQRAEFFAGAIRGIIMGVPVWA